MHFFGDYPAYMFVIDDVFCKIIEICKTKPTEANYLFTSYNCNLEECYSWMVEITVFFNQNILVTICILSMKVCCIKQQRKL